MNINELLKAAVAAGASDLHLTVASPPVLRVNGSLVSLNDVPWENKMPEQAGNGSRLTPEDTRAMALQLLGREKFDRLVKAGEYDFSYSMPGFGRFRVNAYKQRGSIALAIRLIKAEIPTLEELGFPKVLEALARLPRGLVLITGPTGSGKSTTLASMIDLINSESKKHIITLEDPIEFLHKHKKSIVNQREIGQDSKSFKTALRAAMREDPDVIMVGEMRDLETIAAAITASETGHLVLATLHTSTAAQTIDRIIDIFPPHQEQQITVQLANVIQGIVCQQLLRRIDGKGRVVAAEIMVATPAIRNIIRENKTYQIVSQIQTGQRMGMQTMDAALKQLVAKGLVSKEEALSKAVDPAALKNIL